MSQDTAYDRMWSHVSEYWQTTLVQEDRRLQRLVSGTFANRGRMAAVAAIALLRGRVGRKFLKRMAWVSVLFIYEYLVVVELIVALLVAAKLACHAFAAISSCQPTCVLSLLKTSMRDGHGDHDIDVGWPVSDRVLNQPMWFRTISNRNNARPARGLAQTLDDEMQRQLSMEACAGCAATPAPIRRESVLVEFPQRQPSSAMPKFFHKLSFSHRRNINRPKMGSESNKGKLSYNTRPNWSEGPSRSLAVPQQLDKEVVIHFQLPIYVCDLTFWNDIHITVPPSSSSTANNSSNCSSSQRHFYQIEMRMWVEVNRDFIVQWCTSPDGKKSMCENCGKTSHAVGKRRFNCTSLNGRLDVHKNTFHAGRKLTLINNDLPDNGLNFKLETQLEQQPNCNFGCGKSPESWASTGAFRQQLTFKLLPRTNPSPKAGHGKSKSQGRAAFGLLGYFRPQTRNDSQTEISKCYTEAIYALEDRSNIDSRNAHRGTRDGANLTTWLFTTQAF